MAEPPGPAEPAGIDTSKHAIFYKEFWAMMELGPPIPGLAEGMIPQGLAYWAEQDWLITSNYREDGRPSTLLVIDRESEQLVKQLNLALPGGASYTGHAGGVTVSEQHLWVTSGSNAFWIPLDEIEKAEHEAKVAFGGSFKVVTRASFGQYDNGILWVGDFHLLPNYPPVQEQRLINNEQKQYAGWIAGYRLDPETDQLPANRQDDITPDYIISIPDKVQGVAFTKEHVYLSLSYGRHNDSTLIKYERPDLNSEPHTTTELNGQTLPVWFLDGTNELGRLTLPPMAEGIVTTGEQLYILYESGAKKFSDGNARMAHLSILDLAQWAEQP